MHTTPGWLNCQRDSSQSAALGITLEACHLGFRVVALLAVSPVWSGKVTHDAGFHLFNPRIDLVHCVVLVPIVHGLELAAINGNHSSCERVKPAAQHHELAAPSTYCRTVIAAEVGNRLEVWCQPSRQPRQFDIASRFALQPTA